jgi:hypothetical protein
MSSPDGTNIVIDQNDQSQAPYAWNRPTGAAGYPHRRPMNIIAETTGVQAFQDWYQGCPSPG